MTTETRAVTDQRTATAGVPTFHALAAEAAQLGVSVDTMATLTETQLAALRSGSKHRYQLSMSLAAWLEAQARAKREGRTMLHVIETALQRYVDEGLPD